MASRADTDDPAAGPGPHDGEVTDAVAPEDGPSGRPDPGTARTLAQKIDHLFRTVHPASGEYSIAHVSRATQASGGPGISVATLWALRSGTRDNPTMRNLQALADFFGVPAQYFFDDDVSARVDEQLAVVVALRDAPVRRMAMRASGLSTESLATIADMIERVRKLEGLPESTPDDLGDGPSPANGQTTQGPEAVSGA